MVSQRPGETGMKEKTEQNRVGERRAPRGMLRRKPRDQGDRDIGPGGRGSRDTERDHEDRDVCPGGRRSRDTERDQGDRAHGPGSRLSRERPGGQRRWSRRQAQQRDTERDHGDRGQGKRAQWTPVLHMERTWTRRWGPQPGTATEGNTKSKKDQAETDERQTRRQRQRDASKAMRTQSAPRGGLSLTWTHTLSPVRTP